jgi:hypothetical protein
MDGQIMIKCDHCRHALGHKIHRYWQMRFCSPACVTAYRGRLDEDTRLKISRLDVVAAGTRQTGALSWFGDSIQRSLR